MNNMNLDTSPICQNCTMNTDESITHFLIECPSLEIYRNILKRRLRNFGIVRITTDLLLGGSNEDEHIKLKITEEFLRNKKVEKEIK